jgi:hypothetical protein
MNIELIGFDIRTGSKDYIHALWTQERRSAYLLDSEIKWPLSIDQMVWPSFFHYAGTVFQIEDSINSLAIDAVPNNPRQAGLRLWANMEEMRTFFLTQKVNKQPCGIIIGIKVFSAYPLHSKDWWNAVLEPSVLPVEFPNEWILLGYDIADQDMISGLSNCGYGAEEKYLLQQTWPARLNEYGLFMSLEHAVEFQKITERRVPEHAPFYVYGLFRDPETLG